MSDKQPIAWVQGEKLIRAYDDDGNPAFAEFTFYSGFAGPNVSRMYQLPADAVALVPVTELDEARAEVESIAEDAPSLPALDTPEALRYAASVLQVQVDKARKDPARNLATGTLAFTPNDFLDHADRLAAAARVDAEREQRIEALAKALDNAMPVGCLVNYPSDDVGDIAAALDDLGYRLNPEEAKP